MRPAPKKLFRGHTGGSESTGKAFFRSDEAPSSRVGGVGGVGRAGLIWRGWGWAVLSRRGLGSVHAPPDGGACVYMYEHV